MGVADNKSYKDQYHFNSKFFRVEGDDFPSINGEKKINSTIKENPYMSNVEIEGREVVLQPDLSALFKAVGKRHSKGGMDVLLKPDSFIFSDDKTLALTEDEKELFEFKKGGTTKASANTPAAILKKNVNPKHYNTLINNLDDVNKDDLAKKSSAMMLQKYIQTLGNIAYIQEEKKNFPQGLPEFSVGTAPLYDTNLKNEIDENKQYAKYGGKIYDSYLPKMQLAGRYNPMQPFGPQPVIQPQIGPWGQGNQPTQWDWQNPFNLPQQVPQQITPVTNDVSLPPASTPPKKGDKQVVTEWGLWQGDKLPGFTNRYGISNRADKINDLDVLSQQLGYTGPKNNAAFQKWLYNSSPENKKIIDKWHEQYGVGPTGGKPSEGKFDNKIGVRWQNAIREITTGKPSTYEFPKTDFSRTPINVPNRTGLVESGPRVGQVTGDNQSPLNPDWQFTPYQKISQLYNWLNYANTKRYMPTRSQLNPDYADPALLNEQQAVGNTRAAMNQQVRALRTTSPILAGAQGESAYGQYLDKIPEIGLGVQAQNVAIKNQFRQYNNQVRNNALAANITADQQYYRESVEGRKNFDNLREFKANQAMNNYLGDVEANQKLAYNMMTVNNPSYILDWRSGKFIPNPNRSIMNQQGISSESTMDAMLEYIQKLKAAGVDASDRAALLKTKAFSQAAPYLGPQPSFGQRVQKRGGKVSRNPYKK